MWNTYTVTPLQRITRERPKICNKLDSLYLERISQEMKLFSGLKIPYKNEHRRHSAK